MTAAGNGHHASKDAARELVKIMTSKQRQEAERRLAEERPTEDKADAVLVDKRLSSYVLKP